jgi:hypothetical protein
MGDDGMIRFNEDWIIDIDEYNYTVKKDMHCIRTRTRKDGTPYEENVFETKGYYGSLEKALKRIGEEIIKDKLRTGAHPLREALQTIRDCTKEWSENVERIMKE